MFKVLVSIMPMIILSLLVWGIDPFTRDVWFNGSDDFNFISQAWINKSKPLIEQIMLRYPADGVTRSLVFWPFVLSIQFLSPGKFLQIFYVIAWLLNGIAIARLARVIWSQSAIFPLMAGCLMVTATSDCMTDVIVYGPHLFGIALFFFGSSLILRCAEPKGTIWQAIIGAILLSLSFFTVEYTYPSVPFLIVLTWLHTHPQRLTQLLRPCVAVIIAFLPAVGVLVSSILIPGSHAASVLAPSGITIIDWLLLCLSHVLHNFLPFNWANRAVQQSMGSDSIEKSMGKTGSSL